VNVAPPPPLVCLDPGHGTAPAIARQFEPIAPGSSTLKVKDGGGGPGEAAVALTIGLETRRLLLARGYRVAMTRSGPTYSGGNVERARFCNARHATLMLRIHADASTDTGQHGVTTLYKRGSRRAALVAQAALVRATGAADRGVALRTDLTGFNWASVPAILVETGFMTNPREARLLRSQAYQVRVSGGLAAGVAALLH
jgi:N-acetylmuramoyl-L-alanine amidase